MKILHIDDHPLFSAGLQSVLSVSMTEHVFLTASCCNDALSKIKIEPPDLILLDLAMPEMSGIQFMQSMIDQQLNIPVAIISANEDIKLIKHALELGAVGFLPKGWNQQQLSQAISAIEQGDVVIPQHIQSQIDDIKASHFKKASDLAVSKRQLEVLELMAQGLSNKQISHVLFIGENTVKTHIKSLFAIFGSKNRVDCINSARESGLI